MEKILNGKSLVLGSQSPRRAALLNQMGLMYRQISADIDEVYPSSMPVQEVPSYLAKLKAIALRDQIQDNEVLLTSDSVVILNDCILEKPESEKAAIEMIDRLSGQMHTVETGYCICDEHDVMIASVSANVYFRALTKEEIQYYVQEYAPLDKAGSYGIQEWIGHIGVQKIEGNFTTIMGLPTYEVYRDLAIFCAKK